MTTTAFVTATPFVRSRAALGRSAPARAMPSMVAAPLLRGGAAVAVGGAALALSRVAYKALTKTSTQSVTEAEVLAAQAAWSDAIVRISAAQAAGEDFVQVAATAAGELYGYGHGEVLFKPTKATNNPFRPSAEDAMSYFVGAAATKNLAFEGEDTGFAINGGRGWEQVVFRNHKIELYGSVALAMGEYFFKDATSGEVSRVEYTFGYKRNEDGKLRICLHHSSAPFEQKVAPVTEAEVLAAQKLWSDSIVSISKVYAEEGDFVAAAGEAAGKLYGYGHCDVLFKPEDVLAAQKLWADSIVSISKVHAEKGDFVAAAGEAAGKLYGYGHCDVLFKPTKATAHPFRPDAADAMSYFVGADAMENAKYKGEDAGFAINGGRGWQKVVFNNHKIDINGSTAQAMGDYVFTDATSGGETRVEYTFGYKRCKDGKVRIYLHHSSVPFEQKVAAVTEDDVIAAQKLWSDSIVSISKVHAEKGDCFAINGGRGWNKVVFNNHKIDVNGSTAHAMGDYTFTDATSGATSNVHYTFGYKRNGDGNVRIYLHHSSVPYAA
eukprot:CAMPEP_0198365508 /NCGR_PEP_ID=MMETSP1450-20131203/154206_1 /TAXON_ID=753684 ORGANISM="Madagascaria erythrocladiodes, Strain CCMP3234" /NCGR_SAMPLE_ID=MMETSP1450 /ASSEMBLY_ACC=CAM_ASM_001115 /LENGTH=549 /DNA_ID=CAMNT_0044072959 /DNA_START=285 /DNA_END=1934 /DNA_ORIENTATION=+